LQTGNKTVRKSFLILLQHNYRDDRNSVGINGMLSASVKLRSHLMRCRRNTPQHRTT